MGCSCRTFREEPVTLTWVGWAGPVANLSRWAPEAPPELTSLSYGLGRGSPWLTIAVEHSPLSGRYFSAALISQPK
jgi:hypothetical protein